MSHIDFVIAFVLMISIIFFVVLFISNSFSTELSAFTINELKESSYYFEKQLFEILDNKSLISDAGEIQVVFEEIGVYSHTEEIRVSIEPLVSKLHVYDTSMNEIASTSAPSGDNVILSFWLTFSSNEKKRVNIFYFGDSITDINYLTPPENNVTARMLSEKRVVGNKNTPGIQFLNNGEIKWTSRILTKDFISEFEKYDIYISKNDILYSFKNYIKEDVSKESYYFERIYKIDH